MNSKIPIFYLGPAEVIVEIKHHYPIECQCGTLVYGADLHTCTETHTQANKANSGSKGSDCDTTGEKE